MAALTLPTTRLRQEFWQSIFIVNFNKHDPDLEECVELANKALAEFDKRFVGAVEDRNPWKSAFEAMEDWLIHNNYGLALDTLNDIKASINGA